MDLDVSAEVVPYMEGAVGLREQLAALEHEKWLEWAEHLQRWVSLEDQQRWRWDDWRQYMVPYQELAEDAKDKHREWADKILAIMGEANAE